MLNARSVSEVIHRQIFWQIPGYPEKSWDDPAYDDTYECVCGGFMPGHFCYTLTALEFTHLVELVSVASAPDCSMLVQPILPPRDSMCFALVYPNEDKALEVFRCVWSELRRYASGPNKVDENV